MLEAEFALRARDASHVTSGKALLATAASPKQTALPDVASPALLELEESRPESQLV
jgi:hypothetical protein